MSAKAYGTLSGPADNPYTEWQRIAEALAVPIYLTDADGRLTYFNEAAVAAWGRTPQLETDRWCAGWKLFHADGTPMPHAECPMAVAVTEDRPVSGAKVRLERPDGKRLWLEVYPTPLHDEQGDVIGGANVVIDVTAREWAEAESSRASAELRELNRNLEDLVAERTDALQRQSDSLRSLAAQLTTAEQRERKRLASVLHDDLQQLVAAAQLQVGNARRSLEPGQPAGSHAVQAVAQTERLLDDIMTGSRSLTRQLRPPLLYEGGIGAALNMLASDMGQRHGLTVSLDVPAEEPAIPDDVKALVFDSARELLFNAAKYASVDRAFVRLVCDKNALSLFVQDSGCGFEPESAAEGDPATGGIGLFSIRERVRALGGELTINSRPNEGTQVVLMLDVRISDGGRTEWSTPTLGAWGQKERAVPHRVEVLVVDDHTIVRQGISHLLDGHEQLAVTGEAGDGTEAIEMVRHLRPDVALVDVNLPGISGPDLTRELRRQWPATAVVGMSVQTDEHTANLMLGAGAAEFVPKAGDVEQMANAILEGAKTPVGAPERHRDDEGSNERPSAG